MTILTTKPSESEISRILSLSTNFMVGIAQQFTFKSNPEMIASRTKLAFDYSEAIVLEARVRNSSDYIIDQVASIISADVDFTAATSQATLQVSIDRSFDVAEAMEREMQSRIADYERMPDVVPM